MNIIIGNSYSKLEGEISTQVLEKLIERLTYYNSEAYFEKESLINVVKWCKDPVKRKKINARIYFLEKEIWKCMLNNDLTFGTGLLPLVEEVIQKNGQEYTLIDKRIKPESNQIFRWHNKPLELRYYQKDMVDLAEKNPRGVFVSAVGSGKSLIEVYITKQKSVNTLIIVPSKGLLSQLGDDFIHAFGTHKVHLLDSKKVREIKVLKPIRIITIQSVMSLIKTKEISKLTSDVSLLQLEEAHHLGSQSYIDLLPHIDHIYYRYASSGSFLRNDSKTLEMWSVLSNVLYTYYPKQAISDGFLTPTQFIIHSLPGITCKKYQDEYSRNYCGGSVLLSKVLEIIKQNPNKTVLVLVNRKDSAGKIIHKLLKEQGIENSYVSGDDKQKYIDQVREDYNANKIKVLVASQIFGEGINIQPVEILINCQGNKSEIQVVQAIGRGVRLFQGKDQLKVHDFFFEGTKYLSKHLQIRLDIYERNFGGEITILE